MDIIEGVNELTYPYASHPARGTTVEVAEGVRWLTMPMGGSLNHINLYLIEDRDGWYVVDTGLRNEETASLWRDLFARELGGRPVKGVICTHMHPDHVGQAGMITTEFRCPLYMTRAEYYQARAFAAGGASSRPYGEDWQGVQFYRRYGMRDDYVQSLAAPPNRRRKERLDFAPTPFPLGFHRLEDGDLLTIGDHDWQVVVGAGHSPEHACLHCKSLGVLISGDQILPVITSNVSVHPTEPEANPLLIWMESHDKFLVTPPETLVLPAHNLPFYGVRERLRQLVSHHEDRLLAVEEHCIQPRLAAELLPVLFRRKLDARQTMMALGEAIAHCHLLMHRNRLQRTLSEDGRYRFLSIDPDLERRAHPQQHDAPDDQPILV